MGLGLSGKSIIDRLRDKGWEITASREHDLGNLHGKSLGTHKIVPLTGPKNKFGATYFQLFLQNTSGDISQQPVIIGLHNTGKYPSYNWIEINRFTPTIDFSSGTWVLNVELTKQLLQLLADLLPPGGHLMAEYDSLEQLETARSLALGIPPAATPLGYILFLIGCGAGFKDWYFAEGGTEGPRKLQGFKALNSQQAQTKNEELVQELKAFLNRAASATTSGLERAAKERAKSILQKLDIANDSK